MTCRKFPWIAIVVIVLLRCSIGWQLFYEGIWKTKTLDSPTPWTSSGYLRNSQGPFRNMFRSMTGDPYDLDWLDVKKMTNKWKHWERRFARHYRLTDSQKRQLRELVDGRKAFYSDKDKLASIPECVDLDKVKLKIAKDKYVKPIHYDKETGRLVIDGKYHLRDKEYTQIDDMLPPSPEAQKASIMRARARQLAANEITQAEHDAPIETDPAPEEITVFRTQLNKVYERSLRLSYIEKLRAELIGSPDLTGSERNGILGEKQKYLEMIADYEQLHAAASEDFQFEHLDKTWRDLQAQRSSLVNPIKALEQSLHEDAFAIIGYEQMQRHGAMGAPWSGLRFADTLTILGLTLCGFCLIIGLFTRFSAIMAAIMLFMFYMAMPPLPGLPEAPGPEHSLIVNKNLIEVIALIAIACLPTGYWFGVDQFAGRWLHKLRSRFGNRSKVATGQPATG